MNETENKLVDCESNGTIDSSKHFLNDTNIHEQNTCNKLDDPFSLSNDEDNLIDTYQPVRKKPCLPISADIDSRKKAACSISELKNKKKIPLVAYIHSDDILLKANKLTRVEGRAELVHSLIAAYGILQYVKVIPPRPASHSELLGFHSNDYIQYLQDISGVSDSEDCEEHSSDEMEGYGLSYDCPLQKDVFETATLIGGASQVAAEQLLIGSADIVINWYGGWHHAKRDKASGFCYINDIVLCILKLRENFKKVLYVDIDLHHGDGVEEAFASTTNVMTVSFHKCAPGFFPGTGNVNDVGGARGRFFTVNIPLMDGIKDKEYFNIFTGVMSKVKEKFLPEAVVMQCGADGLSEDPMESFNLTHIGIAKCVCYVLTWNLPTVLLGGGGYNFPNTAKCWTFLTAIAAGKKLPIDIPEHKHLLKYGPSYELAISPGNKKDCNTDQYLAKILIQVENNLSHVISS